jgi:hypothetical protein
MVVTENDVSRYYLDERTRDIRVTELVEIAKSIVS